MRVPEERYFQANDGATLFYRYWAVLSEPANRAIILLHRGHEHSGRFQQLVDELNLPHFSMFAWDARGHGRSPLPKGSSPSFGVFVKDLDTFAAHVSKTHGIPMENIAVIGQSIGSVLAAAWAHDYAPKIRCMVLAAPAFRVKLYVPFAHAGLKLLQAVIGDFHVKSYVKASALTHDAERIASYNNDPLITRPISVRVLLGLYDASERVAADAQAIRVPTQVLISGSDWVVRQKPQHRFFDRLGTSVKEKHVFEGFYHDTLGEKNRHLPIGKAREFILKMFEKPPALPCLLNADQSGYTKAEFDTLSRPLPMASVKGMNFALTRLGMKTGGRLSDGIRLGLETGFDSGSTLDYVYRATASGVTPIGKWIDWFYLNSTGWRGIRLRKENIERLLIKSMELLRAAGRSVRILDVAAGYGRYVLEALERSPANAEVLFRDYREDNVDRGCALIREKKMDEIARYEKGDAFDRESLAGIRPHATVGVVSGLYELFPENAPVRESLAGLADAIEPGGYLIYTGQPFHPQLELIARTLSSHRQHRPWVMRRRTQEELDQLVEAAGFRKLDQEIDEGGIFTVSLAQKVGPERNGA